MFLQKKFEGTKVSVETFLTWKKAFDAEMIDMKKITTELERSKKLTGRLYSIIKLATKCSPNHMYTEK